MNQKSSNGLQLELIEAVEFGGRRPAGWTRKVLLGTALAWAVFQLWVASPLPFSMRL
ncbi:MAG: hypothetical protein KZQ81_02385 [Candidatus Thiodiazotropha sp. (ex Rostrolucina anterorostrata)]|nr:hypothetical protein [Candidatus Thiodiazotropha sp. (ex Rostrolucina anterorostrata)]